METLKQNVTNHDDANIVKREEHKLKLIRGNMKHINKINELIKKLINNEVLNANDLAYIDSIQ